MPFVPQNRVIKVKATDSGMRTNTVKTWDDEERHFLQICVEVYGCGREILHDMMGRQYGDKYRASRPERGPYKPQRFWDEYTQRFNGGKPVELNKYIYQEKDENGRFQPYSTADVAMRSQLDVNVHALAALDTGKNPMSGVAMRQIVLGSTGIAAHYATGNWPNGPLAPGTSLPAQPVQYGAAPTSEQQPIATLAVGTARATFPGAATRHPSSRVTFSIPSRARTASARRKTAAPAIPASKQPSSRPKPGANNPAANTAVMPPPPRPEPVFRLRMLHRDALDFSRPKDLPLASTSMIFEVYRAHEVPVTSPIYAFGGQVFRWVTPNSWEEDCMLCDLRVCDRCEGGLASHGTEEGDGFDPPFVHLGRDCRQTPRPVPVFEGVASRFLWDAQVPKKMIWGKIEFVVDGEERIVNVVTCDPAECAACLRAVREAS